MEEYHSSWLVLHVIIIKINITTTALSILLLLLLYIQSNLCIYWCGGWPLKRIIIIIKDSKVIGPSTSSLRSKLANTNSTLLSKLVSSQNTSYIFLFPFNHSSLYLYIRQRLVCTYPIVSALDYSSLLFFKLYKSHMCSNSSSNKRM